MRRANLGLLPSSVSLAVILTAGITGACSSGSAPDPDGSDTSSGTSVTTSSAIGAGAGVTTGTGSFGTGTGTGSFGTGTGAGSFGMGTGTGTGTGPGTTCTLPTGSGSVSFANDVLIPIFQVSCSMGGSTCHGDPSVATLPVLKRPYLGPASGTADAATIETILCGLMQPAAEDPSMPMVSPGSDTNSFLMHKMDDTQGTLDCSAGDDSGNCGAFMPNMAVTILPQTKRDTVRAWINEGAPNN
jgi:hypothetical protein